MSIVEITGTPVASFEFINLPTWNTLLGQHWRRRSGVTKEWRMEGNHLAWAFQRKQVFADLHSISRALVVVKVCPPFEEISDIHNISIKAIADGFTDAGLWPDDEWAYVPLVVFMWAGLSEDKKRRTTVEIHELEALVLNDESQILPLGREEIM